MTKRLSAVLAIGLACMGTAAYGQSREQDKVAADKSWGQFAHTQIKEVAKLATPIPSVPPPTVASTNASTLLGRMRYLLTFSEAHSNPDMEDSEHYGEGLSQQGCKQAAQWIKELEKSDDDLTWLKEVSEAPSSEDMEIIRRAISKEPWVKIDNVFFMGGDAWSVVSWSGTQLGEAILNVTSSKGPLPVGIVKADLGRSDKEFVLLHEGFHMKQKSSGVPEALIAALRKADPQQEPLADTEISDFVAFLNEGRAQRNAVALANQLQLEVTPSFLKYYADNVTIVTGIVDRAGDKALDSLLDDGNASPLVESLGVQKTRLLIHSVYVWQNAPLADRISPSPILNAQ